MIRFQNAPRLEENGDIGSCDTIFVPLNRGNDQDLRIVVHSDMSSSPIEQVGKDEVRSSQQQLRLIFYVSNNGAIYGANIFFFVEL